MKPRYFLILAIGAVCLLGGFSSLTWSGSVIQRDLDMKHWTVEVEGIRTLVTVYDAENEEDALMCFEQEPAGLSLWQQLTELPNADGKWVCDEGAKYRTELSLPEEIELFETVFKAAVAAGDIEPDEKEGYVAFLAPVRNDDAPPNDCYGRAKIIEGLEGEFAEKLTSVGLARMPARRDETGMTARLGREDAPGALGRCENLNQNTVWIDVPVKALGFGM